MQTAESAHHKESSAPPSQIEELIQYSHTIKRHLKGYKAVHLHFSVLDRLHKQPYHRRQIAKAFNRLVKSKNGQLFWLSSFDLFFICKDCTTAALDSCILDAKRAVGDSPVMKEYIDAQHDDDLCDWYKLETDYSEFVKKLDGLKNRNTEKEKTSGLLKNLKSMVSKLDKSGNKKDPGLAKEEPVKKSKTRPQYDKMFKQKQIQPMGPMQLDMLERNLENTEMSSFIAEQSACVVVGNAPPQPIFTEKFMAVSEIKKTLMPDYDLMADKWLFQRLSRTFDVKLMQYLLTTKIPPEQVVSININVETIFTEEFDQFLRKFKRKNDQPLILEFKLFDMISDISLYYEAQKKIAALGCKTCLDAMDVESICVLDRKILNVDFLKIYWKKKYTDILDQPIGKQAKEAIQLQGKMRVILCLCDSQQAIDFGDKIGIHLFQGFLIDKKRGV